MENAAVCNFVRADFPEDMTHHERVLEAQVEQFWRLDTCQSLASGLPQMSQNDKRVVSIWDNSVSLVKGHYELEIPFKNVPPELVTWQKVDQRPQST
jgi:hypothetical protein